MFGFGNRNRNVFRRNAGIGGLLAGGGLRRAAVAGLGMMALRWWRSRKAAPPAPQGAVEGAGWSGTEPTGRPATQW